MWWKQPNAWVITQAKSRNFCGKDLPCKQTLIRDPTPGQPNTAMPTTGFVSGQL
jgi:hypothetical protein